MKWKLPTQFRWLMPIGIMVPLLSVMLLSMHLVYAQDTDQMSASRAVVSAQKSTPAVAAQRGALLPPARGLYKTAPDSLPPITVTVATSEVADGYIFIIESN